MAHLGDEDLIEAWTDFKAHGTNEMRNRLVLHYTSLVRYVATKVATGLPPMVDREDLMSYGIFGLMDAIQKFDPGKGVKFETYAVARIRGHIIDELRHLDWVPRSVRSKARDIERASQQLEHDLGRPPEESELAEHLGMSISELWNLMSQASVAKVKALDEADMNVDAESGFALAATDVAYDPTANPEELYAATGEITNLVAKAVDQMPQRSKTILVLYYLQDMTLAEIGAVLGVTESRVCQLQSKCLSSLRDSLSERLVPA